MPTALSHALIALIGLAFCDFMRQALHYPLPQTQLTATNDSCAFLSEQKLLWTFRSKIVKFLRFAQSSST